MTTCPENPVIRSFERTGYPFPPYSSEMEDNSETRLEYIRDTDLSDFFDWLMDGDEDVVERYVQEHRADYDNWRKS